MRGRPLRRECLVALIVLFAIPLALFMTRSIELEGGVSLWKALFLAVSYSLLGVGAFTLLLRQSEERACGKDGEALDEGLDLRRTSRVEVALIEDPVESEDERFRREIEEALPNEISEVREWVEVERALKRGEEVASGYDAQVLLERCLEKAEALSGLDHLSSTPERFRELSLETYAIDLRRLFDTLRQETGALVVLYSCTERRLLFANDAVRSLFAWSPDRFIKDFFSLIRGGKGQWEDAMENLIEGQSTALRLVLQCKGGEEKLIRSTWGVISAGAFQSLRVGILFV